MSSTPTTPTLSAHPEMEVDQHSQVGYVEDLTVPTPVTADEPPQTPRASVKDINAKELAKIEEPGLPAGLKNFGCTCYINATVQMFRAIPELRKVLDSTSAHKTLGELGRLYTSMSQTTDAVDPTPFIKSLESDFFRELTILNLENEPVVVDDVGYRYPEPDAGRLYSLIVDEALAGNKIVEGYMTSLVHYESWTNDDGSVVMAKAVPMTKTSWVPGRFRSVPRPLTESQVEMTMARNVAANSRSPLLARLPMYLMVHMNRFVEGEELGDLMSGQQIEFWTELNMLDSVTDELKGELQQASEKLVEIERVRKDRARARKNKASTSQTVSPSDSPSFTQGTEGGVDKKPEESDDLEDESVYRKQELEELEALISDKVKADIGASPTGLYELIAVITHDGQEALCRIFTDQYMFAGHHVCLVKKSALRPNADEATGPKQSTIDDEDNSWYKFNDDEVTVFPESDLFKHAGGPGPLAYMLLYKTRPLA